MTPYFRIALICAALVAAAFADAVSAQELKRTPPTILIQEADREIPLYLRKGDATCVVKHRGRLTVQYIEVNGRQVKVVGLYVWCPANDVREDT